MKPLQRFFILILIALLPTLGGCGASSEVVTGQVCLTVTTDFGEEVIFQDRLPLDRQVSVMELLGEELDVKTEYGGGFVSSINGLESGYGVQGSDERYDWFYFINGIMTSVGAVEYFPTNGDVIWWDYHHWGNIPFTPAVIGAFPQPFVNGYQGNNPGTLVLYEDDCHDLAKKLASYLGQEGVKEVELRPYREGLVSDREKVTLVISGWGNLSKSSFWAGVQEHRDKTGWFAELEAGVFYTLDEKGQRQEEYTGGAGTILATATGMGDPHPLWLVTGLDKEGIEAAVEVLIGNGEALAGHFGALVDGKSIIALPVR